MTVRILTYTFLALGCCACHEQDTFTASLDSAPQSDLADSARHSDTHIADFTTIIDDSSFHETIHDIVFADIAPRLEGGPPDGEIASGMVALLTTYDATVKFGFSQANAVFFAPQPVHFTEIPLGSCKVYHTATPSWFGIFPPPSATMSVGASISLTSPSALVTLSQVKGQYASTPQPFPLDADSFEAYFPGADLPAYPGPGIELLGFPGITSPQEMFGEVSVQRNSSLSVMWNGSGGDFVVIELFSHPSTAQQPIVTVACLTTDNGSFVVPANMVTQTIVGGRGQLEVTRIKQSTRTLSDGQAVQFLGITSYYWNARY